MQRNNVEEISRMARTTEKKHNSKKLGGGRGEGREALWTCPQNVKVFLDIRNLLHSHGYWHFM